MPKILWISLCSVHDRANATAVQIKNMIDSLSERGADMVVLTSTIRSSTAPCTLADSAREQILHSPNKFLLRDGREIYIYIKTASHQLKDMTTLEQEQFYNELTPVICGMRPDLVIVSGSDFLSMACINQLKRCGIPTVFMLLEPPSDDFRFQDVDLILSTSHHLIQEHVTPLELKATYVGPFLTACGPLSTENDPVPPTGKPGRVGKKPLAAKAKVLSTSGRNLILLVDANAENGLSLFVEIARSCYCRPQFKKMSFAVLEAEENQFIRNIDKYYNRSNGQKSYDSEQLDFITVLPRSHNLEEVLKQTRVLINPAMALDCAPFTQIEALSQGVSVITTSQPLLKEFLGTAARYIDVSQDLIDYRNSPPASEDTLPWIEVLEQELGCEPDADNFLELFQNYTFNRCAKRLALALKPLCEQHAGNQAQLMRLGTFSIKEIISREMALNSRITTANSTMTKLAAGDSDNGHSKVTDSTPDGVADQLEPDILSTLAGLRGAQSLLEGSESDTNIHVDSIATNSEASQAADTARSIIANSLQGHLSRADE